MVCYVSDSLQLTTIHYTVLRCNIVVFVCLARLAYIRTNLILNEKVIYTICLIVCHYLKTRKTYNL